MRGIIEGLLMIARLDSAEAPATLEPCDLACVVRETVELLSPMADGRGIALEIELVPAACQACADHLAQVVNNLVSNAIHYNRPGGSVRVTVAGEPETAILSVSDTGCGIAPEDLPHIFERFYRADKSRSSAQGHSGLGLAITKTIIDGFGGSIEVTSIPGEGSTFCVRVPTAP